MPEKLALIIGNNDYSKGKLQQGVKDATDLANVLKSVGFTVNLEKNLKSDAMYKCIKVFIKSIQSNDFIIFFFAGHGVQWGDQNFLMPCDNDEIENSVDIQRYATNAQQTLDQMANMGPRIIVFLLDCCREYWLPKSGRSGEQSVGGLNQMKAPPGTLIVFACGPGATASDKSSASENGIFTKYLLEHITSPGIDIEKVLRRVGSGVAKETNNNQQPFRVSSIIEDDVYVVPPDHSRPISCKPAVVERTNDSCGGKNNSTTFKINFSMMTGCIKAATLSNSFDLKEFIKIVTEEIGSFDQYRLIVGDHQLNLNDETRFNEQKGTIRINKTIFVYKRMQSGKVIRVSPKLNFNNILSELSKELKKLPTTENECCICVECKQCTKLCRHFICEECFIYCLKDLHYSKPHFKCPICSVNISWENHLVTQAFIELLRLFNELEQCKQCIDCQLCTCGALATTETMYPKQKCELCFRVFCFFCNEDWNNENMRNDIQYTCSSGRCYYETLISFTLEPLFSDQGIALYTPDRRCCPLCYSACARDSRRRKYSLCRTCDYKFCSLCMETEEECKRKYGFHPRQKCTDPIKQTYAMFPRRREQVINVEQFAVL